MSSTKRGRTVRPHENYPTPAWCVHRLLEAVRFPTGLWLEPCAGRGDIVEAVGSALDTFSPADQAAGGTPFPIWDLNELRPECEVELLGLAASRVTIGSYEDWDAAKSNVAITNPPFSLALKVLRWMLAHADHVAVLQRLNWIGAMRRHSFFRDNMPDVYVLPNRPSFTGLPQTDSIEYAWFVYGPDRGRRSGSIELLDSTPVDVRTAERKRMLARA